RGLADRARFEYANAMDLPYPDGSFDAVFALEFLFQIPDRPRAIQEIGRVLRPGGRIETTDYYLRDDVPVRHRELFALFREIVQVHTVTRLEPYLEEFARAEMEIVEALDISEHVWPTRARNAARLRAARDELAASMGAEEIDKIIAVTEGMDQ